MKMKSPTCRHFCLLHSICPLQKSAFTVLFANDFDVFCRVCVCCFVQSSTDLGTLHWAMVQCGAVMYIVLFVHLILAGCNVFEVTWCQVFLLVHDVLQHSAVQCDMVQCHRMSSMMHQTALGCTAVQYAVCVECCRVCDVQLWCHAVFYSQL